MAIPKVSSKSSLNDDEYDFADRDPTPVKEERITTLAQEELYKPLPNPPAAGLLATRQVSPIARNNDDDDSESTAGSDDSIAPDSFFAGLFRTAYDSLASSSTYINNIFGEPPDDSDN